MAMRHTEVAGASPARKTQGKHRGNTGENPIEQACRAFLQACTSSRLASEHNSNPVCNGLPLCIPHTCLQGIFQTHTAGPHRSDKELPLAELETRVGQDTAAAGDIAAAEDIVAADTAAGDTALQVLPCDIQEPSLQPALPTQSGELKGIDSWFSCLTLRLSGQPENPGFGCSQW